MRCKLGDISEITKLAGYEFTKYVRYIPDGEIIAVRALNLKNGTLVLDDIQRISKEVSETLPRSQLHKNDIVLSYTGTLGECAQIQEEGKYHLAPNVCKITPNGSVVNPNFLFQYIRCDSFKQTLINYAHGSTQPTIPMSTIRDIPVVIPDDFEKQGKIAAILSALDEKIAINREINDNLQQQLFSLYENMAMTSPCLKEHALSNLCDFQEGYVNPPQTHPEYFDGEVKWLRAVDINESFIIETSRTLTKAGFESAKKSALLFKPNTIAISKSGTIGRLGIIADYMCGNRAVINIAPNDTSMLAFIYCFLKNKQKEFPDMAVGSVQKNLYVSLLEPLTVFMPDDELLTEFNAVGNSILNKIYNNCIENTELANLRDTLLPKFMSGEIDVSAVQL